jgi:histidine ammonia-lyase
MVHSIGTEPWHLSDVKKLLQAQIELSDEAIQKIEQCRNFLDAKIAIEGSTYYGINTGFGSLCNVRIANNELSLLQRNLVISHACGMGAEVPKPIVKLILLLKIKNFCYGHSGVSVSLVQRLIAMYNENILPIIYTQGSLGASGDLAPLAHLSLPLLGEGEVWYKDERMSGADMLKRLQWQPLALQSKEGLALLNGTQFMNAYALHAAMNAQNILAQANLIASLSIDAFDATLQPFTKSIHTIRGHYGQIKIAETIQTHLSDSALSKQAKVQVQDPYSFRCIPQVHGASMEAIDKATDTFITEMNAVTDNPLIFPEEDLIVSGGNFHGQILALQLDYLKIALAELANISERRTYLLISGQRGLPPFLANNAGLESGLMIAQYTAASIVSANKQLCTPASVDSIVSSNGQEDHVSMGANAAVQLAQVVENVYAVLGIELLTATKAMNYRDASKTSKVLQALIAKVKTVIDPSHSDTYTHKDMMACMKIVQDGNN